MFVANPVPKNHSGGEQICLAKICFIRCNECTLETEVWSKTIQRGPELVKSTESRLIFHSAIFTLQFLICNF